MMRAIAVFTLSLLTVATLAAGQYISGPPRISTVIDNLYGEGESIPSARLLFHLGEQGELCATLGIKRGPQGLSPRMFLFNQVDEAGNNSHLKFEFPGKPIRKDKSYMIFEACQDEPSTSAGVLQITFRRLGRMEINLGAEKPTVGYPTPTEDAGVNIQRTSNGGVEWGIFYREVEREDPA